MSRARRNEKTKSSGIKIWFPILCILIVAITFFMIHDMQNKIEKNENIVDLNMSDNESVDENTTIENKFSENEIEEDVIENIQNESSNNQITNSSTGAKVEKEQQQASTPGITDQKQKAIELVKKEWGEDDTVNYVFDYVNENGEYVIAVKDKASATVKYYFRVNLETETVELD